MEATANGSLLVRGLQPEYRGSPVRDAKRTCRFARLFKIAQELQGMPQLDLKNPAFTPGRPVEAAWFRVVERRITMSVQPNIGLKDDRRRLSQLTALRALEFFKATSDLLPVEPYIYSSQKGDLVAEFTAVRGTLTSIVPPKFILLFAVVDGDP